MLTLGNRPPRPPSARRAAAAIGVAILIAAAFAACGDESDSAGEPAPLGNGLLYLDQSSVHFPGGEVVDVGREVTRLYRTSNGALVGGFDEPFSFITPDGEVTDLDLPDNAILATDPAEPWVAWSTMQPGDGVVHVLDPASAKEKAAIQTDFEEPDGVTLDGDTVWLYSSALTRTKKVAWRSGKVSTARVTYVRDVRGGHATVEGGNENEVGAGVAKAGIVDLQTGKMVRRGWGWTYSPDSRYAASLVGDDGDSHTQDAKLGVLDLASGKVVRFPVILDQSGWLDWSWTPDAAQVYWFQGRDLVVCEVTSADCTTTAKAVRHGRVAEY